MIGPCVASGFFFFNDTATTEIYTLSLHDALPISPRARTLADGGVMALRAVLFDVDFTLARPGPELGPERSEEHTSELQSRQYLVCRLLLEKKKTQLTTPPRRRSNRLPKPMATTLA